MAGVRKRYDAAFKAKVALEAIKNERTLGEIASEYGVHLTFVITFHLGNGKDILDMSTCMQLSKDQCEFLGMLSVGCAVLFLSGRVFVPLFLVFPRVFISKGKVSDSFVSSLMKKQ